MNKNRLGEVARVRSSQPEERKTVWLSPKAALFFKAIMEKAERKLDGSWEVKSLTRIAEEAGIGDIFSHVRKFKDKGLLGLKEMRGHPDGRGRYGVYWVIMAEVNVRVRPRKKRRPPKRAQKVEPLQLPKNGLANLAKWLEEEIPSQEEEVARHRERLALAEDELQELLTLKSVLAALVRSPLFRRGQ